MIQKYKDYIKESLLDKLSGPSKEELFNNYGFDITFDNPIEFLSYIINKCEIKENSEFIKVKYQTELKELKYYYYYFNDILIIKVNIEIRQISVSYYLIKMIKDLFVNNSLKNDWNNVIDIIKKFFRKNPLYGIRKDIMFHSKNYELKESLLDKLEGPSEEDIRKLLDDIYFDDTKDIEDVLKLCIKIGTIKFLSEYFEMYYEVDDSTTKMLIELCAIYGDEEILKAVLKKYGKFNRDYFKALDYVDDGSERSKRKRKVILEYLDRKNNKQFESLLDKLEGPTKEEIEKHYKNLYLSGKINIFQYYRYSIDNGFKGPEKKDVSDFLEGMYNNKKIKLEEYYELTRDYKLDGPSKSYLWKVYGFDKEYEPEDYFIHLTEGIEKVSPNGLYYNWVKDGKVVFEQYIKPEKLIFMKYDKTFKIYELLFDMNFRMFSKFMKEMFDKYFSDKINIYEYDFRIKYKY